MVIDSNQLIAERLQALSASLRNEEVDPNEFTAGIAAEQVELLVSERDEDGNIAGANAVASRTPAQVEAEAEEILEGARVQANDIITVAESEAEDIRNNAMNQGYQDGLNQGHDEGYAQGLKEAEALKQEYEAKIAELETEYQKRFDELEPMFIDTLTDIYEHIFHVQFNDSREVIFYLLQDAVRKVENNANFIIHVSKDDYGFVSMQKKDLLAGIANGDAAEIVEDMTLKPNECFIETGGGIFDCSLETQLAGLKRELKLLSYSKGNV